MVATYHYTVILEREADGGFHAYCPTLKGCHSQGDSLDEAVDNIREAIEAYLESMEAHGEPVPRDHQMPLLCRRPSVSGA